MKAQKKIQLVGRYRLGWRWVELLVDPNRDGAQAIFAPDDKEICEIIVGLEDNQSDILGGLLHEATEVVMWDHNCAYKHTGAFDKGASHYTFLFTHQQFSEMNQRVAYFLAECLPDFQRAAKKYKK